MAGNYDQRTISKFNVGLLIAQKSYSFILNFLNCNNNANKWGKGETCEKVQDTQKLRISAYSKRYSNVDVPLQSIKIKYKNTLFKAFTH